MMEGVRDLVIAVTVVLIGLFAVLWLNHEDKE